MTDFNPLTPTQERDLRRLQILQRQRRLQEVGKEIDRARMRTCQTLRAHAAPKSERRFKWLADMADREARAMTRHARRDGAMRWLDMLADKLYGRLKITVRK